MKLIKAFDGTRAVMKAFDLARAMKPLFCCFYAHLPNASPLFSMSFNISVVFLNFGPIYGKSVISIVPLNFYLSYVRSDDYFVVILLYETIHVINESKLSY
jgi:hypothetical protein